MIPRRLRTVVAACAVLACTTDTAVGPSTITALGVSPASASLSVGDTLRLTTIATDSRGIQYVGVKTQWSSGTAAVATVSATGAVAGVAVGSAVITATAQGFSATAQITVTPPPVIAASADTVAFAAFANGPVPATQTVIVTNGSPGSLNGITDTVTYGPGAADWLAVTHSAPTAPDTLTLAIASTTFPSGAYVARLVLRAPRASNSPDTVIVRLALNAGAPTTVAPDSGDGQSAPVNTPVAVRPTVIVRDQFGNPVPGVPITFAVLPGGGSVTGATPTTDASGRARVGSWQLGTTAGVASLTATAAPLPGSPVTFTATATPGAPSQLVKTAGDAQTATVNSGVATPPAVRVEDQFGNAVSGTTVTFAPTAGSGSVTAGVVTADANGLAAVGTWTVGTDVGTDTLVATAAGGAVSVRFTATVTAAGAAQIVENAGNGQSATVNTAVATQPQVRVTDQFGNPVAGIEVTFTIFSGGGSITGPVDTSDAAGLATVGSWTLGTAAGTNTLNASAGSLAGSPVPFTATGTAGPPASLTKSAGDGQSAPVTTAVPVPPAVLVRDAFNNPVSGVPVTFSVTPGNGSLTGAAATTNAAGLAPVGGWTLGSTAKVDTLTASASGLPAVVFTATATAGSAATIARLSAAARTDTIGATFADSVVVTDASGNPVSGVNVTFATGGAGSFSPAIVGTNAAGIAASIRTLGTVPGAATDTAKVAGLAGSPVLFTATTTTGQAVSLAIAGGNSQTDTAGQTLAVPYAVFVSDRAGNGVAGVSVSFTIASGGGSIDGGAGPVAKSTGANGQASVTRTLGSTTGAQTVTATAGSLTGSPQTFTATAVHDAPSVIAVSAGNNQSAQVGTPVPVAPTVITTDQFGNPVAGIIVTFASTARSGSVTKPVDTTDAAGLAAVGSWTLGATAGPDTLTATSAPVLSGSPLRFFATGNSGAATTMAAAAGNNQTDTVRATLATQYAVLVTDASSNPVQGVSISWAVVTGGGSITPSSQTDASGIARATRVLGDAAGTQTATASVGGLTGSPVTFTATANPGNAALLAKQAGDGQNAPVNTLVSVAPAVTVTDAYGNPRSGVNITFTITTAGGQGQINGGAGPVSVATNASGVASLASWRLGTTAGNNGLAVTAGALTPVSFSATGTPGVPAAIAKTAGDAQSATVGTAVAPNPQVQVTDQYGNTVPSVTVTFNVTSGGGQVNGGSSAPVGTNATGHASVTWSLGTTAGPNGMTATVGALTPAAFTATGTAAAAQTLAHVSGAGQADTIGATLVPYVVSVTDQYGNAKSGVNVTFTITTAGSGTIDGSAGPVIKSTGVNGQASVTRVLGTAAGTQTVQASATVPSGSPVTFNATASPGNPTTIAANSSTTLAGTVNTAVAPVPSVTVTDRAGNAVQGIAVGFAPSSGTSGSVTGGSQTTAANGTATVTSWTLDQTVGNDTLLATSSGIAGSPVRFVATSAPGAVSLTVSTLTSSTSPLTACNVSCTTGGGTASTITVTVKDQFGNVIAGRTVTLSSTGTGNTFAPAASGTSNGSGVFSATFSSTVAQAKTISGSVTGSGTLNQTASVTVNPDLTQLLANSIVTATTPITASSGSSLSTVTVTVRDQFANGVSGRTVTIAVSGASNVVNQPASATNASGVATGSFSSTLAQSKTVTASFTGTGGGAIVDNAIVIVNPDIASQVVMVIQPAGATSNTAFTTQPQVRLRDAFGNNVLQSGVTVTASKNAGTGTLSGTPGVTTNASGIATWSNLTITGLLTGYGNHSLTFASGGLTSATSTTFNVLVSYAYNVWSGIYTPSCNSCHAGGFLAYANTVNQPSSCPSTPTQITPNNTSASHLWRKVNGTQLCGGVMPTTGVNATFSDIIARWINQGAPNN